MQENVMLLQILLFILFFFLFFIVSIFCIVKKKFIIDNTYLIIPSICIGLWAFSVLINTNFSPVKSDFNAFYYSGQQILLDPSKLYTIPGYYYMPNFAVLFAISISLLPFDVAYYTFYIINYIIGILTIIEFNKILVLMNVREKIHRFLFLMIISNGYFVYFQFFFNQSKYLLFLILILIIRREFQYSKEVKEKTLNYYLLNYNLLVFAIGMAPYFVFFLLIYAFYEISRNEIFKINNVKKYFVLILIFIVQNFLFFIYPSLIFNFLEGYRRPERHPNYFKLIYLREWIYLSSSEIRVTTLLFTIILVVITFILIFLNKLSIVEKFGYFAITYILFGIFSYSFLLSLILFSLALLLFVPYLNESEMGVGFIKNNKILLIGVTSILLIFFMWSEFIIFSLIPGLEEYPLIIFYNLRWIVLIIIMMISLYQLKSNETKSIKD